jgi:hypothetical protein
MVAVRIILEYYSRGKSGIGRLRKRWNKPEIAVHPLSLDGRQSSGIALPRAMSVTASGKVPCSCSCCSYTAVSPGIWEVSGQVRWEHSCHRSAAVCWPVVGQCSCNHCKTATTAGTLSRQAASEYHSDRLEFPLTITLGLRLSKQIQ